MERCALYARVSTLDKGQDVEVQLQELRAWAERTGVAVVGEYIDKASGAKANRPELTRLLKDAHARRFDSVSIWALDRLSREGIEPMLAYIGKLRAAGVRLRSMKESWLDTDSPVTELMLAIFAWVAKQERERTRERVVAGVRKAQESGTKSGNRIGRPRALTGALELLELRKRGYDLRACAVKLGVSVSSVQRMIRAEPELFGRAA